VTTFHLRTLGGLSLHEGSPDAPPALGASKSLAVLVFLARAPGRAALRSHLSELLWPGLPRRKARRALRQSLYYLTQRAGTELWTADDGRLSLASGRLDVDLWALDRALEEERWADVVEAYGGPFLAGFEGKAGSEFDHWAEAEHERVWAGVKAACHRLVEEALQGEVTDAATAVRYARRCVELNPLDERAQEALVRAHLAGGDRVSAFRAYESYRTLLRGELGDEPGAELTKRTEEIRAALFGRHPSGGGEHRGAAEGRSPAAPAEERPATVQPLERGPASDQPMARRPARDPARERGPEGAAAEEEPSLRWRQVATGLAGAAAVIALVTIGVRVAGAAGWEHGVGVAKAGATRLLASRLGAGSTEAREDSAIEVRFVGQEAAVRGVRAPDEDVMPSPLHGRAAVPLHTPAGVDIGLRDGSGPARPLVHGRADEWPASWAPDARHLLFIYGVRLRQDRRFVRRLGTVDVSTGRIRRFPVADADRSVSEARWSPAGTAVAFAAADVRVGRALGAWTDSTGSDVYVADEDGRRVTDVSNSPATDLDPAWSPDGRLLAFASRRTGSWQLFIVRPDGSGLQQVTFGPGDYRSPAWIDRHELAFVAAVDGRRDLWAVDLTSRATRRLTRVGDVGRAVAERSDGGGQRVESVRLVPRFRTISPGQEIAFQARVLSAAGRLVPAGARRLRWRSSDTSVLRVEGDGRARVVGDGDVVLTVSAGGWRADTLRMVSGPVAEVPSRVLLAENWTHGLKSAIWIPCGNPMPEVVASSGPSGHAFLSNGDANYPSGVLSRRPVSLQDGVSIEVWANLPFDGRIYQDLTVELTADSMPRTDARGPPQPGLLMWKVAGGPRRSVITSDGSGPRSEHSLPFPDSSGAWHRYGLELRPDGSVLYLVDGRLLWRSPPGFVTHVPDRARIVLEGSSLDARILAGPVRVWRGARWVVATR